MYVYIYKYTIQYNIPKKEKHIHTITYNVCISFIYLLSLYMKFPRRAAQTQHIGQGKAGGVLWLAIRSSNKAGFGKSSNLV